MLFQSLVQSSSFPMLLQKVAVPGWEQEQERGVGLSIRQLVALNAVLQSVVVLGALVVGPSAYHTST